MKKGITLCVAFNVAFLLLLSLSGLFGGIGAVPARVLYYLAFALPVVGFGIYARRSTEVKLPALLPDREGACLAAPLVFISVGGVMGVSFLTALFLSLFGRESATELTGSFFVLFSLHALLPSVLEELLFRLIPIALIVPHSRRSAVVISSLLFATAHCNLFEIPYALLAGLVYITVDIMANSVIPSIVMHLVNNTVALVWQLYVYPTGAYLIALSALGALMLLSILFVILLRARYKRRLGFLADRGDRVELCAPVALYILATLVIAILSF